MNQDIGIFSQKILPYLDKYKNNFNYFISILIREIRTNDLIYLNLNKAWYEYNLYEKKWVNYDFKLIINQIDTFYEFFESHLEQFLKKSKLNYNNKNYLLNLNKQIIQFIKNKDFDKKIIYENCCKLFSLNEII